VWNYIGVFFTKSVIYEKLFYICRQIKQQIGRLNLDVCQIFYAIHQNNMQHLKSKVLVFLFVFITLSLSGTTYYVSPAGSDSNSGTINSPWFTLNKAWSNVTAGDILYVRGGTYFYTSQQLLTNKSGTSSKYITISAYSNEKPVFDFSRTTDKGMMSGLRLESLSYVYFKGIRITNLKQPTYPTDGLYGICLRGEVNYCTFELMETDHIGGWGTSLFDNCSNILFLNCDSHHNEDPYSANAEGGGNSYGGADGWQCGSSTVTDITFIGCRAYANSDDGWDLRMSNGNYTFDKCWSFWNGYIPSTVGTTWTHGGNGEAMKVGGNGGNRLIKNCLLFENYLTGIQNSDDGSGYVIMEVYNTVCYKNREGMNFEYGNPATLRNNVSYANSSSNFKDGDNTTHDHNTSTIDGSGPTVSDADFVSVNSVGMDGPRQADGSLPEVNFLKLVKGSDLIDTGLEVGLPFDNKAPDLGAFEFLSGAPSPSPVFVSSAIANASPSVIVMTYDLTLANIVPAASAFGVIVNSVARTVNTVVISGTKVSLTLSSPVVNGDIVTVSYTKPSTNPLQTVSGGQAVTLSAQSVVNNVSLAIPVYVSSAIQNATPNTLEITYNMSLALIVPSSAAFSVKVNSITRTVSTVSISGTKVLLNLSNPVIYGDVVTVAYTKPSTNPIQISSGGQAATLSAQTVTNNVIPGTPPVYVSSAIENATPNILEMTYNLSLATIVPAASAFKVSVNSLTRSITSVSISGTKVLLTLASPVVYGDIVTVGYTKAASNPLQTPSAGMAASLSAQSVTNKVSNPLNLGYINSAVGNGTPTYLEINYNLALANVLPAVSAFSVRINSVAVNLISVSISGNTVNLVLSTAVVYGDVVTVAYNKPATNPLQSTSGLQAATMNPQSVVNKVDPVGPVYLSSSIENSNPSILEITYNETLDQTTPDASAFVVIVNGVKREVTFVYIIGKKVLLTLASPVVYGDVVTVSYIKPANNQLKKATGGTAVSFSFPQPVTNRLTNNSIKKGNISIYPNPAREVINVSIKETSLEPQKLRIFDLSGKLCFESKLNSGTNNQILINIKPGIYIVQVISGSVINFVQKLIITD
jgi:uncharacterized repeat protein (TIGR02059 family)